MRYTNGEPGCVSARSDCERDHFRRWRNRARRRFFAERPGWRRGALGRAGLRRVASPAAIAPTATG